MPQFLHVADEAEGAGAGDVAAKCRWIEVEYAPLASNRRRFEVDLDVEAEAAFGRQELGKAAVVIDANRLDDLQMAAGAGLLGEADRIDRGDKISRGAVHDRRLRAVDLDQDVVDPETREGGQKMLDGADAGARGVAEHGAERGLRHICALGLEEALASARQSGAKEDDAGVDVGRMKDNLGRRRRVNSDAADRHTVAQRGLKPKPHLLLFPGLRPAPIRGVSHDEERSNSATRRYQKLPIAVRPAAAKKSGDSS